MSILINLAERIDQAQQQAAKGCGQSDVLYENHWQAACWDMLNSASDQEYAEVKAALVQRGFDPEYTGYQAEEGNCSLTGIEENWCPCGRHE